MRIVKVFTSLSDTIYFGESEWEFIRETNAWYEIRSEIKTKRLKKEELNLIYSDTVDNYISFSCFCAHDKVEEIKVKMLELMEEKLIRQELEVSKKRTALENYKAIKN